MKSNIKKIFPFYQEFHQLNLGKLKVSYPQFLRFKIFGSKYYWYQPQSCYVSKPKRLYVGKNSLVFRENNFSQTSGGIYIGNYVRMATRVSLLSANHDLYDQNISHRKPIKIGDYCWFGMNTTVLAGVELGPRTIIANGAVVTKSFPEGMCVIGGVPARVIKRLDENLFHPWRCEQEFYGLVNAEAFEKDMNKTFQKYFDPEIFSLKENQIVLDPKYIRDPQ